MFEVSSRIFPLANVALLMSLAADAQEIPIKKRKQNSK